MTLPDSLTGVALGSSMSHTPFTVWNDLVYILAHCSSRSSEWLLCVGGTLSPSPLSFPHSASVQWHKQVGHKMPQVDKKYGELRPTVVWGQDEVGRKDDHIGERRPYHGAGT